MPYLTRQEAEAYLANPRIKDLLRVIEFAEGTGKDGPYVRNDIENYGYTMNYGGSQFTDTSRHPDYGIKFPYGDAAGKYQFKPWAFQEAADALGLEDFGPNSQDLAAIYEADRRLRNFTGRKDGRDLGGLNYLLHTGLDRDSINQLSGAWASFPVLGRDGVLSNESMFEGQAKDGPKSMEELNRVFNERLNNEAKRAEAVNLSENWLQKLNPFRKKEESFPGPLPSIPDNIRSYGGNYE
tara:strand:+ start:67 stop:783 length:717 start_codon:yes stop_codon:yes gene_type:complete